METRAAARRRGPRNRRAAIAVGMAIVGVNAAALAGLAALGVPFLPRSAAETVTGQTKPSAAALPVVDPRTTPAHGVITAVIAGLAKPAGPWTPRSASSVPSAAP